MKQLFKKMIVIVALLIVCTTVLACMSGCLGKDDGRFDTDLFCCMYNEDKTGVIILELTEKGQEQEILVIPEEINGLPVVQLGGETIGYPYVQQHFLKSEKLKKLYIDNSNYISLRSVYISQPVDIIALYEFSFKRIVSAEHHFSQSAKCYTTEENYIRNYDLLSPKVNFSDFEIVAIGNMRFIEIEQTEEKTIWIDNITENGIYYCPYIDKEWYLDKECTIPWDGKFVLPEDENELNLYAKWKN